MTFIRIAILSILAFGSEATENHTWSCPDGWLSYTNDKPYTCVQVSEEQAFTMASAHRQCVEKNSSLIVVNTDLKHEFLISLMDEYATDSFLLGLQQLEGGGLAWKTKEGSVPVAQSLPKKFQSFNGWFSSEIDNLNYGLLYNSGGYLRTPDRQYYSYRSGRKYICEQRPACAVGYFGLSCDKECHCHGRPCNPSDIKGTCDHGCEVGWMGRSCSQAKEDASVTYYCVRSRDLGDYVHIRIHTKGVDYDTITAVDSQSHLPIPWCNSTSVKFNAAYDVLTIKIYTDENSVEDMQSGLCAGHITNTSYSWHIKIQEKEGFVSKNDQDVEVACDQFDSMTTSGSSGVEEKKLVLDKLNWETEGVMLKVADAYTGNVVTSAPVGTSVVLKINYGLSSGNDAAGVMPYNCYATSSFGVERIRQLDENGCPLPGSIISQFHRNASKTLITEPFPLLHLPGAKNIEFHCSYLLCYDDDVCDVGCRTPFIANHRRRHRRHLGPSERKVTSNTEVKTHWREKVATPFER